VTELPACRPSELRRHSIGSFAYRRKDGAPGLRLLNLFSGLRSGRLFLPISGFLRAFDPGSMAYPNGSYRSFKATLGAVPQFPGTRGSQRTVFDVTSPFAVPSVLRSLCLSGKSGPPWIAFWPTLRNLPVAFFE